MKKKLKLLVGITALMFFALEGVGGAMTVSAANYSRQRNISFKNDYKNSFNQRNKNDYNSGWEGKIVAPTTGDYTFYENAINGATIYIEDMNTPLINGWSNMTLKEQTGTKTLTAGQSYDFKVIFSDGKRHSQIKLEWSGPGFSRTFINKIHLSNNQNNNSQKPATPITLQGSATNSNSISLNWSEVNNANQDLRYVIYRNNTIAGYSDTTSFIDSNLNSQTIYSYSIQAYDHLMHLSDISSIVQFTTLAQNNSQSLSKPLNLRTSNISDTSITLNWDASIGTNGVSRYDIIRNGSLIGSPQSATQFTDNTLSPNTQYSYYITAYDTLGNASESSDLLNVWTSVNGQTSINLSATHDSTSVTLSWNTVDGAIGYNVYVASASGVYSNVPVFDFPIISTTYTYTNATQGSNFFVVKPVMSGNIEGSVSNEVIVDLSTSLITSLTGNMEANNVRLNWSATNGAIGYNVYTSTSSGSYSTTPINSSIISTNTYLQTNAVQGLNYYIVKPVYSGNVEGTQSNEIQINVVNGKLIILQVNNRYMTVDGISKFVDSTEPNLTTPILDNVSERVFVPIGTLIPEMGGTIDWDATTQKITIIYKTKKIEMWIGQSYLMLYENGSTTGQKINMDVVPYVNSTYNRTMLPIRFVVQYLGENVQWISSTSSVLITVAP